VGRTATGLPLDKAEFATLPPFFRWSDGDERAFVSSYISEMFPGITTKLYLVAEYAVASVVYHSEFLIKTLPKQHALLATCLFTQQGILQRMKKMVTIEGDGRRCTGIPAHVTILRGMKELEASRKEVETRDTQTDITLMASNSVNSGNMEQSHSVGNIGEGMMMMPTVLQQVEAMMTARFRHMEDMLEVLMRQVNGRADCQSSPRQPAHVEQGGTMQVNGYNWGRRIRLLPEDFLWPKMFVDVAYEWWMQGNAEKGYPPFKNLEPSDFADQNARKRLSDFRYLMGKIDQCAQEKGVYKENATMEETKEIFKQCVECLKLPRKEGRQRRTWQSVATWCREQDGLHR